MKVERVPSLNLRLHDFLASSRANGPGTRAVVWVQGCSLACPGCFNRETHSFSGGERIPTADLFHRIAKLGDSIQGVTISGGEPLQQVAAVAELLRLLKTRTKLSVILFTGYTWEEIQMPTPQEFLRYVDVLIAGRYDQTQRLAHGLRGSANKTVHFLTPRYSREDLETVPEGEAFVTAQGEVILSGIEPLNW